MPKITLEEFLSDPAHKERRDFIGGIIDARLKDLIEQRKKEKGGKRGSKSNVADGNIFDDLFGGSDDDGDGDE